MARGCNEFLRHILKCLNIDGGTNHCIFSELDVTSDSVLDEPWEDGFRGLQNAVAEPDGRKKWTAVPNGVPLP